MIVNSEEMRRAVITCLLTVGEGAEMHNIKVDTSAKAVKFDGAKAALEGVFEGQPEGLITRSIFFELFWRSLARTLLSEVRRGAVIDYFDWATSQKDSLIWAIKLVDSYMQPQWLSGMRSVAVVKAELDDMIEQNF